MISVREQALRKYSSDSREDARPQASGTIRVKRCVSTARARTYVSILCDGIIVSIMVLRDNTTKGYCSILHRRMGQRTVPNESTNDRTYTEYRYLSVAMVGDE